MDFQNRHGVRFGVGGPANAADVNAARKERLRRLALETIDLSKDPYFMKNHVGSYECKLCLTIHPNEDSYLTHTQGKKHSTNLARRLAKEQKQAETSGGVAPPSMLAINAQTQMMLYNQMPVRKVPIKIGRPGYKVTKVCCY
jgi:splicing factor 3A subunit 2